MSVTRCCAWLLFVAAVARADVASIEWLTVNSTQVVVGEVTGAKVIDDEFGLPGTERLNIKIVETIKSNDKWVPPTTITRLIDEVPALSSLLGKTCLFFVRNETSADIVLLDDTHVVYSNTLETIQSSSEILRNVRLYARTRREEPLKIEPARESLMSIGFAIPFELWESPDSMFGFPYLHFQAALLIGPNDDRWRQPNQAFNLQPAMPVHIVGNDIRQRRFHPPLPANFSEKMLLQRAEFWPCDHLARDYEYTLVDERSPHFNLEE